MDYNTLSQQLKQLSLFDISRLRAALGHELENPARILQVKAKLHISMQVQYFSPNRNALTVGKVCELNHKNAVIESDYDHRRWNVPYHLINVDSRVADTGRKHREPLTRTTTSIGMLVGFDNQGQVVSGKIIRLNQKSATIQTQNRHIYRVSYGLLFELLEGEIETVIQGELLENIGSDVES